MSSVQQDENQKNKFSKIREYLQNTAQAVRLVASFDSKWLPIMLFKTLLNAAVPFVAMLFSAELIDCLAEGRSLEELLILTGILIAANLLLILLKGAFNRWQKYHESFRILAERRAMAEKSLLMDYEYAEDPKIRNLAGQIDLLNLTTGGLRQVTSRLDTLAGGVWNILFSLAFLVQMIMEISRGASSGSFLGKLAGPVLLIAAVLLASAGMSVLSAKILSRTNLYLGEMIQSNRKFGAFLRLISEYHNGMDIRIYRMQKIISGAFHTLTESTNSAIQKVVKVESASGILQSSFSHLTGGVIYIFVGWQVLQGAISLGGIVKYTGAITKFVQEFATVMQEFALLGTYSARVLPVAEYFQLPNMKYQGSLPVEKRDDQEYEIEFQDVSFCYPGSDKHVLNHVSLKLHIGQQLAVVGRNGSGKTTFIKLLCRLYDPTEGKILLNGIDVRKYDLQQYLSLFSVVFQDFQMFSLPLAQNVSASIHYDRERVMACCQRAGMGDRVRNMEKGLETPLYHEYDENGVEISGGEAQKLAMARALYKDAPFLVLDEPTAALDPVAEFEMYSHFRDIAGDRTAVFISHRLASCRFCHDIAVFDQGQVIQRGSHEELLLREDGKYWELWQAQAQYYQREPAIPPEEAAML